MQSAKLPTTATVLALAAWAARYQVRLSIAAMPKRLTRSLQKIDKYRSKLLSFYYWSQTHQLRKTLPH
jgi:hypothetical protein